MSTILSEYNPSFKTHQSKPNEPKSSLFTCLACQVAFPTSERQRGHYRTDWHKYNLKRKIAQLSSVSAEQFAQKVLAQQAQGREEEEKQGLIYECPLCKKSYLSENAYNNHIQSKKHLELEQKAGEEEEAAADLEEEAKGEDQTMTDADSQKIILDSINASNNKPKKTLDPQLDCLFCHQHNQDPDANLGHMSKSHGFFLPDVEYLKDRQGLVAYLFEKINTEKLCLYCNGRGKEWHTSSAARAHMMDRGHCKMAYDESEDPEQFLKFYDFGTNSLEEGMDLDVKDEAGDQLVLDNGMKLGHRKFLIYYKRNQTRKTLVPAESTEANKEAQQGEPLETLRRKERRHLTITDGKEQELKKTADGIKEASKSQDFSRQLAFKQNNNQTLRARVQNPK